jgi:hypothetical protein
LKEENDYENVKKPNRNNIESDFMIKEAELIINNYIKDNKVKITSLEREAKKKKSKLMKDLAINSILIGGVIAVAFLIMQLF